MSYSCLILKNLQDAVITIWYLLKAIIIYLFELNGVRGLGLSSSEIFSRKSSTCLPLMLQIKNQHILSLIACSIFLLIGYDKMEICFQVRLLHGVLC